MQKLQYRTINWADSQVIEASGRKRRKYAVTCHCCQQTSYLTKQDALKDKPCLSCTNRQKGVKGWAATWGQPEKRPALIDKLAAYQRQHPSTLEVQVAQWLDDLGVEYITQEPVIFDADHSTFALPDFTVQTDDGPLHVEVRGYWHLKTKQVIDTRQREQFDALGHRIVYLDQQDFNSQAAYARLEGAVT